MKNGSYGCAKFHIEMYEHMESHDVMVKITYDALPEEARIVTGERALAVITKLQAIIDSMTDED